MDTAHDDVPAQYRAAGALMVASGVMNLMVGAIWFLSLVWMCVGVYWLVPMAFAIGEIVVGLLALWGIRMRFARAAAVMGAINGVLLFDVYAIAMQGVAFVLQLQPDVAGWLALEDRVDSLGP